MRKTSSFTQDLQELLYKHLRDLDCDYVFCKDMHKQIMNSAEEALIRAALSRAQNSRSKSAEILGINRSTLARKIKKYDISE